MSAAVQSPQHRALGDTVRLLRRERNLSQEALGDRCGLHRNYVGAIERGEINPTFRVLLKLAHGLAIPLSQLITIYENPPRTMRTQPARPRRTTRRDASAHLIGALMTRTSR
jgi:transcriptional regulator with XRE-family HTH domain